MQPLREYCGSKYPYTVDVTSDVGELKQGFSVSVEVKTRVKPCSFLTSVVTEMTKLCSTVDSHPQKKRRR